MRRTPYFVALAAALALVAGPAIAVHVSEPTAPISGIRLRIYQYTNQDATLQSVRNDSGVVTRVAGCDGSVVATFDNLRIETSVQSLALGRTGSPSEHYSEKIELGEVLNFGQNNESVKPLPGLNYADWNHSNIPPHSSPSGASDRGWESSQNAGRLDGLEGKILRVIHTLRGNESGVVLVESCTFTVG